MIEKIKKEFLESYGCKTLTQFKFEYLSTDKFKEIMEDYFLKCFYNQELKEREQKLIKYLEGKIKEYSVISDDYVNGIFEWKINIFRDILERLKS